MGIEWDVSAIYMTDSNSHSDIIWQSAQQEPKKNKTMASRGNELTRGYDGDWHDYHILLILLSAWG